VRKELCICPEVKTIDCLDSLVIFFEYNGKRFINPNVNLGDMGFSLSELGCKKDSVDKLTKFLDEYKNCGSVVMSGVMGDIDYDTPQLLFRGDGLVPEVLQRLTSKNTFDEIVPSDFPSDIDDTLYDLLEYFLKTCNAEHVPYSWLLQYLRLKGCQKCCLYKLVSIEKTNCVDSCPKVSVKEIRDSMRGSGEKKQTVVMSGNMSQMRKIMNNKDKMSKSSEPCKSNKSHVLSKPKKSFESECKVTCDDKCKVPLRKCEECNEQTCEYTFKEPYECPCKDSKYMVKVDTCENVCDEKPCCGSCTNDDDCEDVCVEKQCVKFCDPLSVLKRECRLYNAMNNIVDVTNRYTGFHDHFNKHLDCKFPKGIFQAWVSCKDYEKPKKPSRVVDNNSELLALDHILVSDCLKDDIAKAELSELCFEKCGIPFSPDLTMNDPKKINARPTITNIPSNIRGYISDSLLDLGSAIGDTKLTTTPDYSGAVLKSFFTHRQFCITINCPPPSGKECKFNCTESLHKIGLSGLWHSMCRFGKSNVYVSDFADIYLDKHHFFCDLFYDKVVSKFGQKTLESRLERSYGSCKDNVLAYTLKKDFLCEDEFYTHMLDIYSCAENKEKFTITIGFMEALVKYMKVCATESDKTDIRLKTSITQLFTFLDSCFSGTVKVGLIMEAFSGSVGEEFVKFFNSGNSEGPKGNIFDDLSGLNELLIKLNDFIYTNCSVMAILIDQVCRSLDCVNVYSRSITFLVMSGDGRAINNTDIDEHLLHITEEVFAGVITSFINKIGKDCNTTVCETTSETTCEITCTFETTCETDSESSEIVYNLYLQLIKGEVTNCRDVICQILECVNPSDMLQTVMTLASVNVEEIMDEIEEGITNDK
jgi:hypothetical protein